MIIIKCAMRDKNARSRHMTLHVQNPPVTQRAHNSQGMTGKVKAGSVVRDEKEVLWGANYLGKMNKMLFRTRLGN